MGFRNFVFRAWKVMEFNYWLWKTIHVVKSGTFIAIDVKTRTK